MTAGNSSRIAWEIASRYLTAWVDAIPNAPPLHYVEGFPGPGLTDRVQALDARSAITIFQEDPVVAERCRRELASLAAPHVQLVEADFATGVAGLSSVQDEAAQTLCYLYPPSPGKLPFGALEMVAGVPSLDLLIRFPSDDLHKQARFRGTPLADLPPYARRIVEGYSALLGDRRHEWVGTWRRIELASGPATAEAVVAEQFGNRLAGIAAGRSLKQITLDLPDSGTVYLFCLSADPERALALNAVLESMGLDVNVRWRAERYRRDQPRELVVAEPLELFADEVSSPASLACRQLDEVALAEAIAARYVGHTVSLETVVGDLLDTDVLPSDIHQTIRLLRRTGRAVYRTLKHKGAKIAFPATPLLSPTHRSSSRSDGELF